MKPKCNVDKKCYGIFHRWVYFYTQRPLLKLNSKLGIIVKVSILKGL